MQHSAQIDERRDKHITRLNNRGDYDVRLTPAFRISCLCGHQTDWFTSLSAAINAHSDHIWTEALDAAAREADRMSQ